MAMIATRNTNGDDRDEKYNQVIDDDNQRRRPQASRTRTVGVAI
jgi:hypothetical protein